MISMIGSVHLQGLLESINVTLSSNMLVATISLIPSRGEEFHLKVTGGSDTSEKIKHTLTDDSILWGGDVSYHELHFLQYGLTLLANSERESDGAFGYNGLLRETNQGSMDEMRRRDRQVHYEICIIE